MGDAPTRGQSPPRPPPEAARPREPAPGGEPAADFDALYVEYFAFVWRSLRRLGVPLSALDDAAQNVFLVVHRRLHEFEGRAAARTWLFRIALRVASDARRQARRKGSALEPLPDSFADSSPDPLESAARAEALGVLERLLDGLDDDKRAVFVLADLEQMTNPEIAEALGINLNTVGSRLRAARSAFNDAVARYQRRVR